MRYYLHNPPYGGDTHVWLLDIQVEPQINGNPIAGVHHLRELIFVPNPVGTLMLKKTTIWLDEFKNEFGIWSRGRGFLFRADMLMKINIQKASSFRGDAIFDAASFSLTTIELETQYVSLGHCLPERPFMSAKRNREMISLEWLELARHPIFNGRLGEVIKPYEVNDPY